jgi:tricorn protease
VRNLTQTPGVAERDPAWSPDGQSIAYFSDESGEYELHVRPQKGDGKVKKYALGKAPSFYYSPVWSPDSKKIAYTDKRLNIWYLDLDSGKSTLVDTNPYVPRPAPPVWSPDGRWLAYTRQLKNHLNAVFVHSLKEGKSHRVTDGLSDAQHVQFDKEGQYLYFTASTDAGATTGGIEMSNFNFPVTRSVYVVVLRKDKPSPLAPESDEEKDAATKKKEEEEKKDESPAQPQTAEPKEQPKK